MTARYLTHISEVLPLVLKEIEDAYLAQKGCRIWCADARCRDDCARCPVFQPRTETLKQLYSEES